jgi:predicted nucleotidyltransferase
MNELDVLRLIRDRLSTVFEIDRLILFGSRATGKARSDSDYDVLVIAKTRIPFVKRQTKARLALGPRDFALDLLVYTPAEARRASALTGSAVYWALREGREFDASP